MASVLSRFRIHWCNSICSSAFYLVSKAHRSPASDCSGYVPELKPKEQAQWQLHQVAAFDRKILLSGISTSLYFFLLPLFFVSSSPSSSFFIPYFNISFYSIHSFLFYIIINILLFINFLTVATFFSSENSEGLPCSRWDYSLWINAHAMHKRWSN